MTDTHNLVESVAHEIREAFPHQRVGRVPRPTYGELGESDKETWRRMARAAVVAALKGIRKPPNMMRPAGYVEMIDALLAQREGGSDETE